MCSFTIKALDLEWTMKFFSLFNRFAPNISPSGEVIPRLRASLNQSKLQLLRPIQAVYPKHLKMRACGKRAKPLSIDLLCDWPEREQAAPTQFQSRRVSSINSSRERFDFLVIAWLIWLLICFFFKWRVIMNHFILYYIPHSISTSVWCDPFFCWCRVSVVF